MKQIEVEFRALLTKEKYDDLLTFLESHARDLGADDKRVWFFVMPDKLLKVTHNISRKSAKVTLKLTKIGHGSAFEEIEYAIGEGEVPTAVRMFEALGYAPLVEPTILRHNFDFKGVELAVKYSKSWGHHAELEILVDSEDKHAEAEEKIREVAEELEISVMTDEELRDFTRNIEENYVAPTQEELTSTRELK